MDTTVSDALVGRLVDGRYRVQGKLARGGMATVYRAMDVRLDRPVALKVMHPGLAEDQAFVARFIREARSAARLSDPGVVAVYDQGKDDSSVFLAMEYVPGGTLRDRIRERGRLSPREAFDLLEPVLSALAAAHRAGIVHRDVKPENVLLADDGRVKVADFGLARSALSTGGSGTTLGVVMGTVAYLAPEQVERGVADPRSDVYSAGILLYEMLTGAPPFSGETPMAVAYQHVTRDVPPPSAVVRGLAPAIDWLVAAATARDPAGRPADAGAMLALVKDVRSRLTPAQLGQAGPSADTVDLTRTLVVPTGAGHPNQTRRTVVLGAPSGTAAGSAAVGTNPRWSNRPPGSPGSGIGGPGQVPAAARSGKSRRRVLVGLLVLLLVAAGAGVGAWYLGAGRYTTTPSVLNFTANQADAKLASDGLKMTESKPQYSEIVGIGRIISSDPSPGQRVAKNGTVAVVLSLGKLRYKVPSVVNMTLSDATAALTAQHLAVGTTSQNYSPSIAVGRVISSSPAAGASLKTGTPVNLVVSRGLPPVGVPKLIGSSLPNASQLAAAANLQVNQTGQQSSMTVPKGDVISQSPAPGTQVAQNSSVSIVLSTGPPLVLVPDVVGMSTSDARKALKDAGFKVHTYNELPRVLLDTVYTENPGGGSKAPKGSTVNLGIV